MAIDNIDKLDNLNTGRVKLNEAIDQANLSEIDSATAIATADGAVVIANTADAKSTTTQQQLDTIVIASGTSDAETIQARGGEPLLYNRLDNVDTHLADVTPLSSFPSLIEAIANGGAIHAKNGVVTFNGDIISSKAFILQGQGVNATTLTGDYSFVVPSQYANGFRDIKLECASSTKNLVIDFTNAGSTAAIIDNVQLMNVLLNGIRIKKGLGHIIRDSFIYAPSSGGNAGTGLEISPGAGDWNNIVNIFNTNFAWFNTALNLGAVVTCNVIGCHFGFITNGIVLKTTPPNPTRDILIMGCYFEANELAISTIEGAGSIANLKIKDCFFSVSKIALLKKIVNLKFSDCTHADNGLTRTPNVELESISNLSIENCADLSFKTTLGNTILTSGEQLYAENLLTLNNQLTNYAVSVGGTVKDVNSEGIRDIENRKVVPSIELVAGTTQALVTKRIAYGISTGDVSFLSSRGIGAKMFVKASAKCSVSMSVVDSTSSGEAYCAKGNISDQWVCLEGLSVTGIIAPTADVTFRIDILPLDSSLPLKVYVYDPQVWLDYIKAPNYLENIYPYYMFRRKTKLTASSLGELTGLFLPTNTYIEKSNSSVFTPETQKGWRVSQAGYNYNNVNLWLASTVYLEGDYVKLSTGHLLLCTKNGTSGLTEPTTPSGVGTKLCPTDNTTSWISLSAGSSQAVFVNDMY